MDLKVMRVLVATVLCLFPWIIGIEAPAPLFLESLLSNPKLKSRVSSSASSSSSASAPASSSSDGILDAMAPMTLLPPYSDYAESSSSGTSSYAAFQEPSYAASQEPSYAAFQEPSYADSKSSSSSSSSAFSGTPPLVTSQFAEAPSETLPQIDFSSDKYENDGYNTKRSPPPKSEMLPTSVITKLGYPSSIESFRNGPPSISMFDINAPPIANGNGPPYNDNPFSSQLSNPPSQYQSIPPLQVQSYDVPSVSSSFDSPQFSSSSPVKEPDYDDFDFLESTDQTSSIPGYSSTSFSDGTSISETSETTTDESDKSYGTGGSMASEVSSLQLSNPPSLYQPVPPPQVQSYDGAPVFSSFDSPQFSSSSPVTEPDYDEFDFLESTVETSSISGLSSPSFSDGTLVSEATSETTPDESYGTGGDMPSEGSDSPATGDDFNLERYLVIMEDVNETIREFEEKEMALKTTVLTPDTFNEPVLSDFPDSSTDIIEPSVLAEEDSELEYETIYSEVIEKVSEYTSYDTDDNIKSTALESSSDAENTSSDKSNTEFGPSISGDSINSDSELESSMFSETSGTSGDESYDSRNSESPSGSADSTSLSEAQNVPMSFDTINPKDSESASSSITDTPTYSSDETSDTEDISWISEEEITELESMDDDELKQLMSELEELVESESNGETDPDSISGEEERTDTIPSVSDTQNVPTIVNTESEVTDSNTEKSSAFNKSSASSQSESNASDNPSSTSSPSAPKSSQSDKTPSSATTSLSSSSSTVNPTMYSPSRNDSKSSTIPVIAKAENASSSQNTSTSKSSSSTSVASPGSKNTSIEGTQTNASSSVAKSEATTAKSNASSDSTSTATSTDSIVQKSTTPSSGRIRSTSSAVSSSTTAFSNASASTNTRNVASPGRPSYRSGGLMMPGFARSFASAHASSRRRVAEPKRCVCFFNSQEYYKEGFTPKFINATLCTHINYEFAYLDGANHQLIIGDPKLDIQMNFIEETVALKKQNPNMKILLSMGGWTDSTRKYSVLVSDENKRRNFISNVILSLNQHKFDGLDIAWEYPNAWQGAIGICPQDRENFAIFLQEIRNEFDKVGLYLSASCASVKEEIEAAYGPYVPAISNAVHHLNVMSFDLHGPWEHKTGHHAQFDSIPNESYRPHMNMKSSLKVWEELGVDKKKVNCGIPFYGRSFTLSNAFQHDIGSPTKGIGRAGPNSREGGYLAFNEICLFMKKYNWQEVDNDFAGTYAFYQDQWVSFDSMAQAVKKAKYIVEHGFGGIMVKDVSADDYKGECYDHPFPLLTALKNELDKIYKFETG